jgi:solute:Na+ symporter, SSS family
MEFIGAIDWFIIVAYLVAVIAFGLWMGRGQKDTRDYFLGSRNIPWWGVSLSIVATETSALTFIGVPAIAFGGDLAFIQVIIGYVIARIILAAVLVPHYFKGEIYSPYQLFEQAFGPAARRLASVFFLIAATLAAGVRVYVTCIPLDLMMGDLLARVFGDPIIGAILLFVGLSLIYTYVGGIKAVVWTDAIQFLLLMGGGLFALFYIPTLIEGGLGGALSEASQAGKLKWLNTDFALAMPFNLWMGLIGATVMVLSTHGADQLIVQRVLTCKDVKDGRKALVLSAVIILPLFLVFLLTGAMLWVYYQHHAFAIPLPETQAGFNKNDYIFPIFILTAMPPVMKGLMIVAILSAAMSSVSSALSALASVSTMDLFKGWSRQQRDEAFYLRFSKRSTLVWAVLLVFVAWGSREVVFVLNWAFSLNGLTNGALLGGLALALWWGRGSALPVIAGMLAASTSGWRRWMASRCCARWPGRGSP